MKTEGVVGEGHQHVISLETDECVICEAFMGGACVQCGGVLVHDPRCRATENESIINEE